jgi:hypothetical protein
MKLYVAESQSRGGQRRGNWALVRKTWNKITG